MGRKVLRNAKGQAISWKCALCGAGHIIGSAFDLVNMHGEVRAVCKGGCDE